jgi:DNA-binding PadR family transcriptional regulator
MKDYVQGGTLTEVTDLILLSLYEPRHGYAIIQFVEEVTNGRVLLGAGTLYGALSSLEQKGIRIKINRKITGLYEKTMKRPNTIVNKLTMMF